jgi:hypothetical protein
MSLHEALSRTLLLARDQDLIGQNTPTDEQLIEAFQNTAVLLVADEANLSSPAGQHAFVALFTIVARLGVSIRLAMPEIPILGFQPPVRGYWLQAGLIELGNDLIPECAVRLSDPTIPVNLALILGDAPWGGKVDLAIRLVGDDWSGQTIPANGLSKRWEGVFPVGALVAAGIAAPEVFKLAIRNLGKKLPYPMGDDFLVPVERAHIRVAPLNTPIGPYHLGALDCVSGGAIINSALFTLLHLPDITADVRVIEPEQLDLSNLNRYPLSSRSECGSQKITALRNWSRTGFHIDGLEEAFSVKSRDLILPFAPRILVGTDDIPARWAVQREWPKWLGVGATSHFLTVTSSHMQGLPCAGCLHPFDDPDTSLIPTISFVSYWAGLLLAIRLLRHYLGHSQTGIEQRIECTPLRLDQPRAYWKMPVALRQDCPVTLNHFDGLSTT